MRKILSCLSILFVVPLAACFDAELSLSFPDQDNAVAEMKMIAGPEFYAMATSDGDEFCDGEETTLDDGSHVCTEQVSGTIDEIVNDADIGDGMTVERRDGGLLFVSFDLGDLTEDITPPEEEGADEMAEMMKAAFVGHSIKLNVSGAKVVETNGTLSEDGKTASYEIPLGAMFEPNFEMPKSFDVLLKPGS